MSLTVPTSTGLSRPRSLLRRAWGRLRLYGRGVPAPPPAREQAADRVVYGMAQPILGARVLLTDPHLLREALVPAAWLAIFCALVASLSHDAVGWWGWWRSFYKTFAVLAPLPSIIFARHYARLAAVVRWRLGFGPCGPREYPLFTSLRRAIQQAILVAVGVLPFALIWKALPGVGIGISQVIVVLWGVHWVVVDAFDDARVLLPGETVRSAEATDRQAPPPWFVRLFFRVADRIRVQPVAGLLRRFGRFCDRLALPWRGEFALMEANPSVALGFALSTAALLATPGLNLLFRPIILVASSHLLGHLEAGDPAQHPQLPAVSAAGTRT